MLKKLFEKIFKPSSSKEDKTSGENYRGILIFESTTQVIQAERLLKEKGYKVEVVGPPPEVRQGCDLALRIPVVESVRIINILKEAGIPPLKFVSYNLNEELKGVSIFQVKDFGEYIMVRAANMKITVNKKSGEIVNVSGGGCPDVPYLAKEFIGKNIKTSPEPNELGSTLCGYALNLAFLKAKEIILSQK